MASRFLTILTLMTLFAAVPEVKAQYLNMSQLEKYRIFFKEYDKTIAEKDITKLSDYFTDDALFIFLVKDKNYRRIQKEQTKQAYLGETMENFRNFSISADREFISAYEDRYSDNIFAVTYTTYTFTEGKKARTIRFREHFHMLGDKNTTDYKIKAVQSYFEIGLLPLWNTLYRRGYSYR